MMAMSPLRILWLLLLFSGVFGYQFFNRGNHTYQEGLEECARRNTASLELKSPGIVDSFWKYYSGETAHLTN